MKFKLLTGNKLSYFLHVIAWAILFVVPSYLMYRESSDDVIILIMSSSQTVLYAIIFYVNYIWLAPRLFFENKKVLYFITAVLLILCMSALMGFVDDHYLPGPDHPGRLDVAPPGQENGPGLPGEARPYEFRQGDPTRSRNGKPHHPPLRQMPSYNFILTSIFITGFSIGLRYSEKVIQQEKERKEAEKEKLNSELAFLKNQINPHFFFNTLNNIYSLVQTNVPDGQKAILQLSKLMRYLLYETEKGDILLSQEIDFMRNFIELMKLRISPKVSLDISFPENYPDVSIPPLLFLPFIENAFKHGISYRHRSFISIRMKANQEEIIFGCINSMGGNGEDLTGSDSGIGLENVKKRLSLLFPLKHHLQVFAAENTFNVSLHIDLVKIDQS
jgi:two-component system LytT family sensor kinase